jgi:hypothetical protein
MEAAEHSPSAEVSQVAVQLPPFWAERPAVWFTQAEAQFFLAGIISETTEFYHVISQLDQRYAAELEDIITSPPTQDPYTTLRTKLVRLLSPTREERIHQIGDRKPSQFLRHLRSLVPDVPDDVLRNIWSSRLPPNVRTILACQHEANLDAAARTTTSRAHPSRRSLALPTPRKHCTSEGDPGPLPSGDCTQCRTEPSSHQLQGH